MSESGRLFAIGDIHGCADELERLLAAIPLAADDTIVFVGDYIDRGPDSAAVIAHLLALPEDGPPRVFLKGNHEDMALDFLGLGGFGTGNLADVDHGEAVLTRPAAGAKPLGGCVSPGGLL